MSTRPRKTSSEKSKNAEPPNKPLVRKVASKKAQDKKEEISKGLKASQRKRQATMKEDKHHSIETDPKFQEFSNLGARIAQRAYELYEARGRDHGHDLDDWIEAERQILMEEENKDF